MNKIIVTIICLVTSLMFSQKMITRSGEIKFDASIPGAVDAVAATNNTVSCVFNSTSGEIATVALIKSFKFKSPLMEEHFNENYMESDKLPKSSFKGKIVNFDASKSGNYDLEGELTIHGVTNKIKAKVNFASAGGKLIMTGSFMVKLADYKLTVPALAKKSLADTAKISMKFELENK